MKREADWPRYMKAKRLAGGRIGYYWTPHERDRRAGFTIGPEALGQHYEAAVERARLLNEHLDSLARRESTPLSPR